jgi:RNA polymerase sigma factor (TIGR02999 family)
MRPNELSEARVTVRFVHDAGGSVGRREGVPMTDTPGDVTLLLASARKGDRGAVDALLPIVYKELRRVASVYMRKERVDNTLQPTALVHEAYMKLVGQHSVEWQNRAHFLAVAAQQMRRILVDRARARSTSKRGGEMAVVQLDEGLASAVTRDRDLVALDEALRELARKDERLARVVELRFFGGLTIEETAEVLRISTATVDRDWVAARAWLRREMRRGGAA